MRERGADDGSMTDAHSSFFASMNTQRVLASGLGAKPVGGRDVSPRRFDDRPGGTTTSGYGGRLDAPSTPEAKPRDKSMPWHRPTPADPKNKYAVDRAPAYDQPAAAPLRDTGAARTLESLGMSAEVAATMARALSYGKSAPYGYSAGDVPGGRGGDDGANRGGGQGDGQQDGGRSGGQEAEQHYREEPPAQARHAPAPQHWEPEQPPAQEHQGPEHDEADRGLDDQGFAEDNGVGLQRFESTDTVEQKQQGQEHHHQEQRQHQEQGLGYYPDDGIAYAGQGGRPVGQARFHEGDTHEAPRARYFPGPNDSNLTSGAMADVQVTSHPCPGWKLAPCGGSLRVGTLVGRGPGAAVPDPPPLPSSLAL